MSVSRRKIGAPPSYVANGQNAGGDFSGLWLGLVGHQPTHQLPFGDGKQENAQGGGGKRLNNHPSSCRRQGTGHVFLGMAFRTKDCLRHQCFASTHLCHPIQPLPSLHPTLPPTPVFPLFTPLLLYICRLYISASYHRFLEYSDYISFRRFKIIITGARPTAIP